jgi:hypothetical protein
MHHKMAEVLGTFPFILPGIFGHHPLPLFDPDVYKQGQKSNLRIIVFDVALM